MSEKDNESTGDDRDNTIYESMIDLQTLGWIEPKDIKTHETIEDVKKITQDKTLLDIVEELAGKFRKQDLSTEFCYRVSCLAITGLNENGLGEHSVKIFKLADKIADKSPTQSIHFLNKSSILEMYKEYNLLEFIDLALSTTSEIANKDTGAARRYFQFSVGFLAARIDLEKYVEIATEIDDLSSHPDSPFVLLLKPDSTLKERVREMGNDGHFYFKLDHLKDFINSNISTEQKKKILEDLLYLQYIPNIPMPTSNKNWLENVREALSMERHEFDEWYSLYKTFVDKHAGGFEYSKYCPFMRQSRIDIFKALDLVEDIFEDNMLPPLKEDYKKQYYHAFLDKLKDIINADKPIEEKRRVISLFSMLSCVPGLPLDYRADALKEMPIPSFDGDWLKAVASKLGMDYQYFNKWLVHCSRLYNKDRLSFELYTFRFGSFSKAGFDQISSVALFPQIPDLGSKEDLAAAVKEIVNADEPLEQKKDVLDTYNRLKDIDGVPLPRLDKDWFSETEEKIRSYVENNFGTRSELPLETLIKLIDPNKIDEMKLAAKYILELDNQDCTVKKEFRLGKEYMRKAVTGIKERLDPVKMTELLVYGLISTRQELRREAENYFEKEQLEKARERISSFKTTYQSINNDLEGVKQGYEDSAKALLEKLKQLYPHVEDISDLVSGVEGLFLREASFDYLACKMQDGKIADLFDNRRLMCCAFFPDGVDKTASLFYQLDPNIGLLQLAPVINSNYADPIGVAIAVNSTDKDGTIYLMIDSVEGGMELKRLKESMWKEMVYESIIKIARDNGAEKIMYNSKTPNAIAKKFLSYVKFRGGQEQTVYLEKIGGVDAIKQFGKEGHCLEAWDKGGTWNSAKGEVTGLVIDVR